MNYLRPFLRPAKAPVAESFFFFFFLGAALKFFAVKPLFAPETTTEAPKFSPQTARHQIFAPNSLFSDETGVSSALLSSDPPLELFSPLSRAPSTLSIPLSSETRNVSSAVCRHHHLTSPDVAWLRLTLALSSSGIWLDYLKLFFWFWFWFWFWLDFLKLIGFWFCCVFTAFFTAFFGKKEKTGAIRSVSIQLLYASIGGDKNY